MTTFSEVALSPDGGRVAFITARDDFAQDKTDVAIWWLPTRDIVSDPQPIRLTHTSGSYRSLRWSPNGRYLAFLSTRAPADVEQVFVIDSRGGEPYMVTDKTAYPNGIAAFDWAASGQAIWGAAHTAQDANVAAKREAFYGDATRYVPQSVQTTIRRISVQENDEAGAPPSYVIPHAVAELRTSPNGQWLGVVTQPVIPGYPFMDSFAGFDVGVLSTTSTDSIRILRDETAEFSLKWGPDSESLFMLTGGDSNSARLTLTNDRVAQWHITSNQRTTLGRDSPASFQELIPLAGGSVLARADESTQNVLYRLWPDGSSEELARFDGRMEFLSVISQDAPVVFALTTDTSFTELYVAPRLDALVESRPQTQFNRPLTEGPNPTIETVRWTNSDGTTIEGALFWPPGQRGAGGLPLIVDIHGGPWLAMTEALDTGLPYAYYPALLASRGYLVLEPNYRGSIGRGDAFLQAVVGHSCSRPADDILSGVDHLIAQGWVDTTRMGIMGYSYGGLMTNCIIGRTRRFRAAISGAGLWNELSYFGASDNFIQSDVRYKGQAPWENVGLYWDESAISRAGAIQTPTLVLTGDADRRVPYTQSFELFRALVRQEVPTELLVFPGEGHIFSGPKHKLTKVRAEIDWLDHYLLNQPRAVPIPID